MKSQLFVMFIILFTLFSCKKENAEIPLAEHPQPIFERSVWQNLNGYWQFKADSTNVGLAQNWQTQPETFDRKILVPFSWASPMSEITLPKVNVGWYSREFTIGSGKDWKGKNVYLIFGASDFRTKVWVNNQYAGEHKGGYIPFEFNISPMLKKGINRLVVMVEDEELDNRPSGKQYYGNAKGIWKTVYLEPRNKVFLSGIRFTPDIDKKQVNVDIRLSAAATRDLRFGLTGKDNNLLFEAPVKAGDIEASFIIPVPEMRLWTLDDPYLYEVVALLNSAEGKDEVNTYFGMRKFSAVPIPGKDFTYVALNNEPLYLRLALDQSYHPEGFYTFPSDQFMREEILRARDLGLNGLRIHIKAEIPRKLYWADKLGLLIMEDVPNFWGEPTPEAKANWEYISEHEI